MSGLSNQIGRYMYADGMRKDVVFEGGRTFTVVVAGAYNAGIIGPEHNGLVVLDADNGAVVLDQHMIESSGYFGPSKRQADEFARLTAMTDWKEFTGFMKSNPRYRQGSVPDIDLPSPEAPDEASVVFKAARDGKVPGLPGADILPDAAKAAHEDPAVPYAFPYRTRLDIAAHLAAHATHGDHHGPNHLAWNIKVHSLDTSGRAEGFEPDAAFDGLWEAYVERNSDMVYQGACEDALREYMDGEATSFLGEGHGSFEFSVGGRSGGWLEMTKFNDTRLSFRSMSDLVDALLEMDESELADLYVGVVTFDQDIQPKKNLAFQFAALRQNKEEDWADPELAEEAASEAGLTGWVHPGRQGTLAV